MRRQEQSKQGFSLKLACQLYVAELYDVQAGALNTGRQIWFEYGPSSKVLAVIVVELSSRDRNQD